MNGKSDHELTKCVRLSSSIEIGQQFNGFPVFIPRIVPNFLESVPGFVGNNGA
jgi:hypothetical protein